MVCATKSLLCLNVTVGLQSKTATRYAEFLSLPAEGRNYEAKTDEASLKILFTSSRNSGFVSTQSNVLFSIQAHFISFIFNC